MLSLFRLSRSLRSAGSVNLARRKTFAELQESDIDYFKNKLGVSVKQDDLDKYNETWLRTSKGNSKCVVRPKNTEEVSSVLKYCNEKNL